MKIIITYDVDIRHPEVKTELLKVGFLDRWKKGNVIYYLPNTTLWHNNLSSPEKANQIFQKVIESLNLGQNSENNIIVKHFMAFNFTSSSGTPGEVHAE